MEFETHTLLSLESQMLLAEAASKAKTLPVDSIARKKIIERAIDEVRQRDAGRFKKNGCG